MEKAAKKSQEDKVNQMEIQSFKTNINSPIGIQAIWDALKSVGISNFNIDFYDVNKILKIVSDPFTPYEKIINALVGLGYQCEKLS
jgi:tRNA G26 N,N-dimethylase Trm1